MKTIELHIYLRPGTKEDFVLSGSGLGTQYRFGKQFFVKTEENELRMERLEDTKASRLFFKMVFESNQVWVIENANDIGHIRLGIEAIMDWQQSVAFK